MKKLNLSFIFCVIFCCTSLAKNEPFQQGYYLTLEGDTIKGLLFFEVYEEKSLMFFKSTEQDKKHKLSPQKIKGFYLADENRTFISVKSSAGWQFLEKVLNGYYTVYLVDLAPSGFSNKRFTVDASFNYLDVLTHHIPVLAVQKHGEASATPLKNTGWKNQVMDWVADNKLLANEIENYKPGTLLSSGKTMHEYYKVQEVLTKYNRWKVSQK